jgi:GNAT superfamily N-acetyltransferase
MDAAGRGLGVGRWVRLRDEPDAAEFSLTIVDEAQGRGLGVLLFAVLCETARRHGVRRLRGIVARSNDRMIEWMRRLGATPAPNDDPDDGAVALDFDVRLKALRGRASGARLRAARERVRPAVTAASRARK